MRINKSNKQYEISNRTKNAGLRFGFVRENDTSQSLLVQSHCKYGSQTTVTQIFNHYQIQKETQ